MAETVDDEHLVKQFNRGDNSAFDRIVGQYSADVAVLVNRLLGWPGDVEDVTQDVFLSAFLGLKKFRCECSLRTWLFTIAINKCRSHRYKRMLRPRVFSRREDELSYARLYDEGKTLMDKEVFERVRRAVRALPPRCREPVVLRYLHELPTDQICRILGLSSNALHVRLHRARQLLKRDLADLME